MKCYICERPAVIEAEWRDRTGLHVVAVHGFCNEHRNSSTNWSGQVTTSAVKEVKP